MSQSPPPVNATAAALLGFLHEGPMTGWELAATADALIGDFWTVTRSQVYRELAAMDTGGMVRPGAPGPRDRRPYRITAAGRHAFARWLDREPRPEQIRYPLLLTIAFGKHLPPGRLAAFVAAHRSVHAERLKGYLATRADLEEVADAHSIATIAFGIRYETAVLGWIDDLPPAITAPEGA